MFRLRALLARICSTVENMSLSLVAFGAELAVSIVRLNTVSNAENMDAWQLSINFHLGSGNLKHQGFVYIEVGE